MKIILLSALALALTGSLAPAAAPAGPPPSGPNDLVYDSEATIQHWVLPAVPEGFKASAGRPLAVQVRFIVDAAGKVSAARVLKSPDPKLEEPALAAVRSWTFSAALQDNKPIAASFDVIVRFNPGSPASLPKGKSLAPPRFVRSPVTEAEVKTMVDADYPAELTARKLPGIVQFVCALDGEGHRSKPTVIRATHVAFVLPALAAVAKWEVAPARQGDLPKTAELRGDVTFDAPAKNHAEVLTANFITAPDGGEPSEIPGLESTSDPVWPYGDQLAGEAGEAKVLFTVGMNGAVENISVESASNPEFGSALAAAVALWRFSPATRDGQAVPVSLATHWTFGPPTGDEAGSDEAAAFSDLLKAAKAGKVGSAAGLDRKLRPIFRMAPIYPAPLAAAGRPVGEATLNVIIARDGRVRLPQIVSATSPEFGWAAAAAAAQWVFEPPLRAGKPVDVKVQVPFQFHPPPEG